MIILIEFFHLHHFKLTYAKSSMHHLFLYAKINYKRFVYLLLQRYPYKTYLGCYFLAAVVLLFEGGIGEQVQEHKMGITYMESAKGWGREGDGGREVFLKLFIQRVRDSGHISKLFGSFFFSKVKSFSLQPSFSVSLLLLVSPYLLYSFVSIIL